MLLERVSVRDWEKVSRENKWAVIIQGEVGRVREEVSIPASFVKRISCSKVILKQGTVSRPLDKRKAQ